MTTLIFVAVFIAVFVWGFWYDIARKRRRRDSLRHEDGAWFWIGLDGVEHRSTIHPEHPGGDWADGSTSDGGDSGGDGGGD